jgi:Nucleotide modification associated domain 3
MIRTRYGPLGRFATPLRVKDQGVTKVLKPGSIAHLDPDLRWNCLLRDPRWVAAFGQRTPSAVRILDTHVRPGDLFLFYGWFRDACPTFPVARISRGRKSCYAVRGRSLHLIFGYLQVKRIFRGGNTRRLKEMYPGLKNHPHLSRPRLGHEDNRIYIATNRLKIPYLCKPRPGAGLFAFDQKRSLTDLSQRRRSNWRLTGWGKSSPFCPEINRDSGSFRNWHYQCNDWTVTNHGFGQEFVIDTDTHPDVMDWVVRLFLNKESPAEQRRLQVLNPTAFHRMLRKRYPRMNQIAQLISTTWATRIWGIPPTESDYCAGRRRRRCILIWSA